MAGDWIKVELVTPDKPEIDLIADHAGVSINEAIGGLIRLWIWADQQTIDGNAVSVTKSAIDLLSAVANQAAVAIENTELMVKTRIIQEELETRKKVERAKGILMKEQKLTEEDAYSLMRKSSMNKRVLMKDIAEAIILTYEIKKS